MKPLTSEEIKLLKEEPYVYYRGEPIDSRRLALKRMVNRGLMWCDKGFDGHEHTYTYRITWDGRYRLSVTEAQRKLARWNAAAKGGE